MAKITFNNYVQVLTDNLYTLKDDLNEGQPVSIVKRDFEFAENLADSFKDDHTRNKLRKVRTYYDDASRPQTGLVSKVLVNTFNSRFTPDNPPACRPKGLHSNNETDQAEQGFLRALKFGIFDFLHDDLVDSESDNVVSNDFDKIKDLVLIFNDSTGNLLIDLVRKYYDAPSRPNLALVDGRLQQKFAYLK